MEEKIPRLKTVAKTLVDNGAVYVAADTQSLVDEPAQLYYHLPAGVSDDQREAIGTHLSQEVGHRLHEQIGAARIGDQPIPLCVFHVLHGELHSYRRTPVYVGDVPGLDSVGIDDGVARVRDVITGDSEPPARPEKTVSLETLISDLAEAGAASVELSRELLVLGDQVIDLRIPMVPADGKPIVGPIESVEIAGETYPFSATLTLSGPCSSSNGLWGVLYRSSNVRGAAAISVEDGIDRARKLLDEAAAAELLQDLPLTREL